MSLKTVIFGHQQHNHKQLLLHRFHVAVIFVNLLAVGIDLFSGRYVNVAIESAVVVLLTLNLWMLHYQSSSKTVVFTFLAVISSALFVQIYLNHFATMSVVFVLLLPLTTMLFFKMRYSLIITLFFFLIMATLLYLESVYNPDNPLVHNTQALFNLGYAAVIIYLFGLLYHLSMLRTFEELDDANRQQRLLLNEVHHRVKNNLNVMASMITLQSRRQEPKVKEELLKTKSRIESIAIVHEMLYQHEDFDNIDVESYLQRLSDLVLGLHEMKQTVEVTIETEAIKLPLHMMVQLGIMVNELMTNSCKYAFEDREKGHVIMKLYKDAEIYRFVYEDDGCGVAEPEHLQTERTLGVRLIHLAVKQLLGEVKLSSDVGLKYEVEFPDEQS